MIKKILISIFIALLLITTLAISVKPKEEEYKLIEELDEIIAEPVIDFETYHQELEKIYDDKQVLGMSVVCFKDGEIIDSYNIGYLDNSKEEIIDDKTTYRIASLSKMISNILIMQLVDEGLISLDSNLNEITGLEFNEDVKLKHILTHTSGLRDPSIFNENLDKVYDINYLLKLAKSNYKAGESYCYSNFAAGTMSAIIESVTGTRFYEFANDNLFKPLNLNMAYLVELLQEDTSVCKMYTNVEIDPKTWMFNKQFYDQFEIGKQYRLSYGNLYASASDLAKLGMALAGNGEIDGIKILSEEALELIRKKWDDAKGYKYESGLNTDIFTDFVEGRIIYGHTGSAYNAYSCMMYDPIDKTGVVVLTNHANGNKNEIGYNEFLYDSVNAAYKYCFDIE